MGKDYIRIQLKDMCYYDDDFEYEPFIVKKDKDFEKKFKKLERLCKHYDSFDEVENFIDNNFEKLELDFEERIIYV